jgi:hypothetical protein
MIENIGNTQPVNSIKILYKKFQTNFEGKNVPYYY